MRTKRDFLKIVRDSVKQSPSEPVRLDVHADESAAVKAAADTLFREGFAFYATEHYQKTLAELRIQRVLFAGPEWKRPAMRDSNAWSVAAWSASELGKIVSKCVGLTLGDRVKSSEGREKGTLEGKAGKDKRQAKIRREYAAAKIKHPNFSKEGLQRTIRDAHPRTRGFSMRSIQAATKDL